MSIHYVQWVSGKDIMPEKDSAYGFLVIMKSNEPPVHAHFDAFANRFTLFVEKIGRTIQIPCMYWMSVPSLEIS